MKLSQRILFIISLFVYTATQAVKLEEITNVSLEGLYTVTDMEVPNCPENQISMVEIMRGLIIQKVHMRFTADGKVQLQSSLRPDPEESIYQISNDKKELTIISENGTEKSEIVSLTSDTIKLKKSENGLTIILTLTKSNN